MLICVNNLCLVMACVWGSVFNSLVCVCVILLLQSSSTHSSGVFQVIGPDEPLYAVVGKDLILPCSLKPNMNAERMTVEWFRLDNQEQGMVHLYKDGKNQNDKQIQSYRHRTALSKEGLRMGNASLKLSRVQMSDEGDYKCLIQSESHYDDADVQVIVRDDVITPPWKTPVIVAVSLFIIIALFVGLILYCKAPQLQAPQLQDKAVKRGDVIKFCWEASRKVNAKWIKDGQSLEDAARIRIAQTHDRKCFSLTIIDAREQDEGKYTLVLWNRHGTVSGSAKITILEYDVGWRETHWQGNDIVKKLLREMHPSNPELSHLRFLLHGPVGAGKSSIINSINCVFQSRCNINAPAAAVSGTTCTKTYKTYRIKDQDGAALRFVFNDIMGLEDTGAGGALPADIISALKGHIREGYEFNPVTPLSEGDSNYNSSPTLNDKVHCLVSVVRASNISLWSDTGGVILKMKGIREAARDLGIPQVVFMTDVDRCCPLVHKDLMHIYSSKRIKKAMQHCSNRLGVPMNCIFPVKNYSEENKVDDKTDCLILDALKHIVYFANDYVGDI